MKCLSCLFGFIKCGKKCPSRLPSAGAETACSSSSCCQQSNNYRFEIYEDKADEWRWRLKSSNHEIIASSGEGFTTKQNAQKACDTVRRVSASARVEELS